MSHKLWQGLLCVRYIRSLQLTSLYPPCTMHMHQSKEAIEGSPYIPGAPNFFVLAIWTPSIVHFHWSICSATVQHYAYSATVHLKSLQGKAVNSVLLVHSRSEGRCSWSHFSARLYIHLDWLNWLKGRIGENQQRECVRVDQKHVSLITYLQPDYTYIWIGWIDWKYWMHWKPGSVWLAWKSPVCLYIIQCKRVDTSQIKH